MPWRRASIEPSSRAFADQLNRNQGNSPLAVWPLVVCTFVIPLRREAAVLCPDSVETWAHPRNIRAMAGASTDPVLSVQHLSFKAKCVARCKADSVDRQRPTGTRRPSSTDFLLRKFLSTGELQACCWNDHGTCWMSSSVHAHLSTRTGTDSRAASQTGRMIGPIEHSGVEAIA